MGLHREAFNKSQAGLCRCGAELKKLIEERDALKYLYVKKKEEIRDLRADLDQDRMEESEPDEKVTNLLKEYDIYPPMEANALIF